MNPTPSFHDAFALLDWQLAMGIDEALEETPQNRFAMPAIQATAGGMAIHAPFSQEPSQHHEMTAVHASPSHTVVPAQAPASAVAFNSNTGTQPLAGGALAAMDEIQKLADAATTLDELRQAVMSFQGLAICKTATNPVFADGNPQGELMVIGEAPGAQEDRQGIPFCGPSGQLLDKMLAAIGYHRSQNCYITNTLFWRPPGNRTPSIEEITLCRPFVEKHIALQKPRAILLAGSVAVRSILNQETSISRLRGKAHSYSNNLINNEIPIYVTYHPSYLLRQPSQKKLAWMDMLALKEALVLPDD